MWFLALPPTEVKEALAWEKGCVHIAKSAFWSETESHSLNPLKSAGSPIKERRAAFGLYCAQHVGDHSCREIKTLLDTQMDLQGLHSRKIYNCTNIVFPKEHSILCMVTQVLFLFYYFFFFPQGKNESNKTAESWKPPSIHWMINSTCGVFAEYMKILTICYSHFQSIKLFKWFVLISFPSLPNSVISCLMQIKTFTLFVKYLSCSINRIDGTLFTYICCKSWNE